MIHQVFEALPVEAPTLASSVQPLQQNLQRPAVELLQSDSIAFHSIVVVIPTELPVQLREEHVESNLAILFAPLGEVGNRVAELLPRCSAHDVWLAGAVFVPAKLEPEKVEPRCAWLVGTREVHHSRLVSSQLEAELSEPKLESLEEGLGVSLILKCANEVIGVSDQTRFPLRVGLHHFLKPQIKRLVQVHMGEHW
jgi:hypothetical protein